jgi:peptidoglycan/xylan/chitin deacetylase (PgdA/CDA1 family)
MVGTFYVIPGDRFTESGSHVTLQDIVYIDGLGMEIGNHTLTHADARYTSKKRLKEEYETSNTVLENTLDKKIEHFCFPIGGTTSIARELLKDMNYKTSVLTIYGKANVNQNNLSLKRIRIFYSDNIEKYKQRIN